MLDANRVEAATLLAEADALLLDLPGAVGAAASTNRVRRWLAANDSRQVAGPASLTTAELRVLQMLPTYLSIREIAERFDVSRNTVKSHTLAIYRKLGTSSRRGAVEIAVAAGLLDTLAPSVLQALGQT